MSRLSGRPYTLQGQNALATKLRTYRHDVDFDRVGEFLVDTFSNSASVSGGQINWLQPRWEYMHFHPLINQIDLDSIGVWEADGEIVAVVHPEHSMGEAYFELHPEYSHLKPEMLKHAEDRISVETGTGRQLRVWINDEDAEFREVLVASGYTSENRHDPMTFRSTSGIQTEPELPEGFRIQSLAEDDDLYKVHRLLWRGFGHGDEPVDDSEDGRALMGIEGRRLMGTAPNFRRDLNIVVVAPNGDFVSYCGMWIEPVNRLAYVEPVATDPDYRRMGLGMAAVLEGVRRCGVEGAAEACVGSTMPFYRSMGFEKRYCSELWSREW